MSTGTDRAPSMCRCELAARNATAGIQECTARTSWCSALRMASRARLELALLFLFICTCVRHVRHPSVGSVTSTGQLGWESELPALSPASAKEDWKMETTQVGRTVAMIGSALGTQPSISSAWETRSCHCYGHETGARKPYSWCSCLFASPFRSKAT